MVILPLSTPLIASHRRAAPTATVACRSRARLATRRLLVLAIVLLCRRTSNAATLITSILRTRRGLVLHIDRGSLHCDSTQLSKVRRPARMRRRARVIDAWEARRTGRIVYGQLVPTEG